MSGPAARHLATPLGVPIRRVVVPESTQLEIAQDAAPRPVTIDCGAAWAGESVRIAPDANLAALPILDPLSLCSSTKTG